MKTIHCLRTTLFSLLPVAMLATPINALAQGACNDMNFTDVTASAGITHTYVWPPTANASTPGGATAIDVDGDGWLDLYAVQGDEGPNLLYMNNGDGTFSEEAAARGAQLDGHYGTAASAADFDNDGDIDLGVSIYFGNSRVLINDGTGNFTSEIVLPVPFDERTFSSSWGDVDNDGYLELAIGMWVGRNGSHNVQGLHLYKNNGGTNLQDYEFRTAPRIDSHIFAPRFADLDGDRLQDLHVVADYDESRVYMNIGGGMFDADWGYGGLNDMGHAIADYDKDGDLDIFTTDIETNNGNTLWDNDGLGNFSNVSIRAGIQDGGWAWAGSFGDLDLDADLDIYHVNGFAGDGGMWQDNPSLLFMNNDDGTFTDVAACAGAEAAIGSMGRGMHFFDYDNDGDLDIFTVNNRYLALGQPGSEGIPVLLRNDTPRNGRHWLKVTLDGTPPMHRDGIGSRVYVTTGSTTQLHEMHASTNYVSQDAGHIAHFGLDTASTADEVRAEWVTGDAVVLTNVGGDQQISIASPTATVSNRTPAIGQNITANANESAPVEWEVGGTTFADPVVTSFSTGGTKELKLLVYNTGMTQVVREELIRVTVAGVAGEPDITSPTNGSVLPAGDVTFSWTDNGASVDDWQLLAGTSVGDNSLYDSGVLSASTNAAIVTGLPSDGSTVHVTLRWSDGGGSSEKYYTYIASAGGGGGVPMMVSPLDGATLTASSETFVWSADGANVDRWRIEVSATAHGSTDIFGQSYASTITSETVSGLPTDGSTVYVRLKYRIDGSVTDIDLTYTATGGGPPPPGTPAVTSPTPGSTFAEGDVTFNWTADGVTVDDWQLLVGTSAGDNSLFDSGVLASTTLSAVVSGLPDDGSTVHVTLQWNESGVPSEANYTYTAATAGGSGLPMMVSPVDGSVLAGASETFTWSPGAENVGRWRLEIGSTPGGTDILVQGFTAGVLSAVISGLPTDGSLVYVRLEWRISGVVSGADYVYTASGGGPPPPGTPQVTSPTPGSTLATGDVTFNWIDDGVAVDDWQLLIGTSAGDNSLYDSGVLPSTTLSAVVSGLPEDGSTIHVTLRWNEAGVPSEANYTYTAASPPGAGVPMIVSPVDGSVLAGASETFTWTADGAAVTNWRLEVGTTVGGRELYGKSWASGTTSIVVSGLPTDGSIVYVKLKWKIDGVVSEANYVYTAALL